MSTAASIGYLDADGNYRGAYVGADGYPESVREILDEFYTLRDDAGDFLGYDLEKIKGYVENGIKGGGYEGLYDYETLGRESDEFEPLVITTENYNEKGFWFNYVYVVTEGKVDFFDPLNVCEYDEESVEELHAPVLRKSAE